MELKLIVTGEIMRSNQSDLEEKVPARPIAQIAGISLLTCNKVIPWQYSKTDEDKNSTSISVGGAFIAIEVQAPTQAVQKVNQIINTAKGFFSYLRIPTLKVSAKIDLPTENIDQPK